MRAASAISASDTLAAAWTEAVASLAGTFSPDDTGRFPEIDLILVFVAGHSAQAIRELVALVRERCPAARLLGSSTTGTVGVRAEHAHTASLSVLALELPPGATATPVHLTDVHPQDADARHPDGDRERDHERPALTVADLPHDGTLIAIADAVRFPTNRLLAVLARSRPALAVIGGHVPTAPGGSSVLMLDDAVLDEGLVGVVLTGAARVDLLVSTGCRPIGRRFAVTRCEANVVLELAGEPALDQLQAVAAGLGPADQKLLEAGAFLGRVANERQPDPRQGDFVLQALTGVDPVNRALAITGGLVRRGTAVQFHVHDPASADTDLRARLKLAASADADANHGPPVAALAFICTGRGLNLFETDDHEAAAIADMLGNIPLAGLHAAGEFGPLAPGGPAHLNSFTTALALFRAARAR